MATSYVVQGLEPGKTYYFAATAYDATGTESGLSNEFVYAVPIIEVNATISGIR